MSSFLKLNTKDFSKGLVIVVIVAILGTLEQMLTANGFNFALYDWASILNVAVVAGIGYLTKNLMTDETGKVLGKI